MIILGNLRTSDDVIGVLRLTTFLGLGDVTSTEKVYPKNPVFATVEGSTFLLQFFKNSAKGQVVSSSWLLAKARVSQLMLIPPSLPSTSSRTDRIVET